MRLCSKAYGALQRSTEPACGSHLVVFVVLLESSLRDLLYIPSRHFTPPPMSLAMASTTPIHFSEVFLECFQVEPSILYIIFHCRLPSVGPLSALGV